jgi:Tripartite tricarboxylate transporter family receptor
MTATGTKLIHIPYKGTAPALNDIIASHVDLMFTEVATALKLHESGKARILAVATDKRLGILPDIPTMEEVGVPNFVSDTWNAISVPPKTPHAVKTTTRLWVPPPGVSVGREFDVMREANCTRYDTLQGQSNLAPHRGAFCFGAASVGWPRQFPARQHWGSA